LNCLAFALSNGVALPNGNLLQRVVGLTRSVNCMQKKVLLCQQKDKTNVSRFGGVDLTPQL